MPSEMKTHIDEIELKNLSHWLFSNTPDYTEKLELEEGENGRQISRDEWNGYFLGSTFKEAAIVMYLFPESLNFHLFASYTRGESYTLRAYIKASFKFPVIKEPLF